MPEAIGIPEAMLNEASKHAVCKINVGTDLRVAYVGALRKALYENPEDFDVRKFILPAMDAITTLVKSKMVDVFGSAGHADDK
jgi:Fructose/tagatose bisphosphate aldolase